MGYLKQTVNINPTSPIKRTLEIYVYFRYGLFDFEYTHQCQGTTEASKKEKLFLMSWCPDR